MVSNKKLWYDNNVEKGSVTMKLLNQKNAIILCVIMVLSVSLTPWNQNCVKIHAQEQIENETENCKDTTIEEQTDNTTEEQTDITTEEQTDTATEKQTDITVVEPTSEMSKYDINDATVDDSNLKKILRYNTNARTPILKLYFGERLLYPNQDYEVRYKDNVNAGTATITVTGIGEFTGSFTRTFEIQKMPLSDTSISITVNEDNSLTLKIKNPELGKGLTLDVDYKYSTKMDSKGNITVTIVALEKNYTGTVTKVVQAVTPPTETTTKKITVKKVQIKKVKNIKKKKIQLKWKKISKVNGYYIRYSNKKSMKKAVQKRIKKNVSETVLKKLLIGKTYYFQVRAYKTVSKKTHYGSWSNTKSVKITR